MTTKIELDHEALTDVAFALRRQAQRQSEYAAKATSFAPPAVQKMAADLREQATCLNQLAGKFERAAEGLSMPATRV